MEITKIQTELAKLDVTYKGYELLNYLRKTFFSNVKGIELQRLRPLVFREARDVKQAFDELVSAKLIEGEYTRGVMSNVVPNIPLIIEIESLSSGIEIVVKKAESKRKKKVEEELDPTVKDIILHYNSHPTLPRPSTATPLVISRIKTKLELYTIEQIKDALDLAANTEWLTNKGSEPWANAAWVFNRIDDFMAGGKYAGKSVQATETKYEAIEDSNTTVFW